MPSLFKKFDSFSLIEYQKKQLVKEVSNLSEQELKGTNQEAWVAFYKDKFFLDVPKIQRNGINVEVHDVKLDARNYGDRYFRDANKEILVDGIEVCLFIPYEGDKELFECSGNSIYHSTPNAEIMHGQLAITYRYTDHSAEKINADTTKDVNYIEGFLKGLEGQLAPFNESIEKIVSEHLATRLEKLKKDEELKGKLAFPLKARPGSSPTYASGAIRSKIKIQRPQSVKGQVVTPEPVISDEDYNDILQICHSMTLVMEKSPHAFMTMGEEDIRQHFLVQLNGRYEGSASGETFNFEGKTDILVKDGNRNVFIAECKFWKGPKTVEETLNQLLGYTSWRDTKTALFLFSRNKNFTDVLKQIPQLVAAHPNFIKELTRKINSETEYRYVFSHRDDPERHLTLTVLVFDVPAS